MAHRVHHRLELGGVQAGLLVGAGQALVQREMLLDDRRAQHGGGHVALPAGRVVGKPHRQAKLVKQLQHGAQVGVGVGGGVLGVAVQDSGFGAAVVVQDAQRIGDLVQRAHAGGKQHRDLGPAHLLQVGQVGDLAGGDLQKRQLQRGQKPHAGDVKRRRQVLDADFVAVFLQLPVAVKGKVQLADHVQLALGGVGGLFLVGGLLGKAADHQLRHGGLIFDDVGAALLGSAGHLLGHFQASVVVDAGFGDDGDRHGGLLLGYGELEIRNEEFRRSARRGRAQKIGRKGRWRPPGCPGLCAGAGGWRRVCG